ncbi:relaxase/mobilization nuclease domain-containing protein [Phocaeicola vulgatus]|nr:relaxase/mobilization nuclease domain-containing protein [Phocaeicola vulgatus]
MIAKGKSISHGTAALEYDLAKEINGEAAATEIHRHELFGCTGEEMVQEMKPYFVDFPNVKNNCLRFEVSPSVEESAGMTDADWAKLGNDFMQRMGLMNHQYIIVKHSGTEKNRRQAHLHILANRVSLSGELYKDNWIGKRATEAANGIARERNLVQSKDIGKANREEIKQAMDGILARMQGFDLAGFSRELEKLGFRVREARASTGKLNGYYVTDADWAKLGNDFMQRMGLMNHQYIIVKHSGTEKNRRQAHLHILANRVSLSGELYKDNWIGKRATEAANGIARERNLIQSKDIGKANREEIKQAMDAVLTRMQEFDLAGFSRELEKQGFRVREARASTGKLNGYYVTSRSGTEYKASEIGKGYTLAHIEKTQKKLKYNSISRNYGNTLKPKDGGLHL